MTLAKKLRDWRGEDKIEHVASAINISHATIYNWERGNKPPRLDTIVLMEAHKPGILKIIEDEVARIKKKNKK